VVARRTFLRQVEAGTPVAAVCRELGVVEPRVKKRRPKSFPFMTRPRQELRQQLLQQELRA
jgi:hypothetical protein